jgi:hypothetical protein
MASCNHVYTWFYDKPFQVLVGPKWSVEYCKCGAKQARLFNPDLDTKPITEDQPIHGLKG